MKNQLFITYLTILLSQSAFSQESLNTSGGDYQSSEGSQAFSIGQPFFEVKNGDSTFVTEGVQQTYVFEVIYKDTSQKVDYVFKIFPNPAIDKVSLMVNMDQLKDADLILFDTHGKLIKQEKITSVVTEIDISYLSNAVYYLHLFKEKNTIATIKIVKQE